MITLAMLVMFAAGFALARVLEGPTKTDREDQDLPPLKGFSPLGEATALADIKKGIAAVQTQSIHVQYGGEGWEPAHVHCPFCGHNKYNVTIKGGNHMAHCNICHRWIKNLSKEERRQHEQEVNSK